MAATFGQVGTAIGNPDIPADPPVEVTGELTVLHIDDRAHGRGEYRYILEDKLNNRRFKIEFEGKPPEGLITGATVKARGKAIGHQLVLGANDGSNLKILEVAAAAVSGTQNTIVMVADFQDLSVSCSVDAVRDLMFTDPSDTSLDDFYQTNSLGQVSFAGDVGGPYPINYSSTGSCDYNAWANAADAAAQTDGFNLSAYNRRVYVMPKSSCSAAGLGTVGGNPSRAWVFYCDDKPLYGHELGHNLVMQHASTLTAEYGDRSDVMGITSGFTHSNAPHKEQMGWMPAAQITRVDRDGIYDIAPLEQDPALALAPQALKIAKPNTSEYYYLSVRRALDAFSVMPLGYLDSVSIHRYKGDGSSSKTYLLDLLQDGESFTDPTNGITVTQLSHAPESATVEVAFGQSVCVRANPTVSISPTSQWGNAGQALTYSVTTTNKDSSACSSSTFNITSTLPSGFTQSPATYSTTLASGASNTTSITVTSPAGTAGGAYTPTEKATNSAAPSFTSSASATYNVNSTPTDITPPVTSITSPVNGITVAKKSTVTITTNASDDVGVTRVGFSVNGSLKCTDTTSPYSCAWSVAAAPNKTYILQTKAYDAAGNVGVSPTVSVTSK